MTDHSHSLEWAGADPETGNSVIFESLFYWKQRIIKSCLNEDEAVEADNQELLVG